MRILVIGSFKPKAEEINQILIQQSYIVDIVLGSQGGWKFIETYNYKLIIIDVVLSSLSSIRFCQQLRQKNCQIPILILAEQGINAEKVLALDAGADDYITKPFDRQEFVARVRALLRRGHIEPPPILQWGYLHLDPSSCKVTYHDQILNLTRKEYALLHLFLSNSHRVFSRSAIIENLWGFEDPPTEETIKSHVKTLRQKLKTAGAASDFIETIYGLGYRLKPISLQEKIESQELETLNWQDQNSQDNISTTKQGIGAQPPLICSGIGQSRSLESRATTYSLANLLDKEESLQILDKLLDLAKRHNQPLALSALKLDNLQLIRRQHGATTSDHLLEHIKQFLQKTFRSTDVITYLGEGEFIVGMYGMSKRYGEQRLTKVWQQLSEITSSKLNAPEIPIIFRIRIAAYPEDGSTVHALWPIASND